MLFRSINDGIYQPLDAARFKAFQDGVNKLLDQCQAAGVKQVFLVTPPIYDLTAKPGEFNYDSVLTEFAKWELSLKTPGVPVIDLHSTMRQARSERKTPFSNDKVHFGDDGHLEVLRADLLERLDVARVGLHGVGDPLRPLLHELEVVVDREHLAVDPVELAGARGAEPAEADHQDGIVAPDLLNQR